MEKTSIKDADEQFEMGKSKLKHLDLTNKEEYAEYDCLSQEYQSHFAEALINTNELITSLVVTLNSKIEQQLTKFSFLLYKAAFSIDIIKDKIGVNLFSEEGYSLTNCLANTIKHGKGKSYDILKRKYRKFLEKNKRFEEAQLYYSDEQVIINITTEDLILISDNICRLWDKILEAIPPY